MSRSELQLALQLVEQIAADEFDPGAFQDEEKGRVLAAIEEKVKGKQIVASSHEEDGPAGSGQVIDLMDALRASLGGAAKKPAKESKRSNVTALKAAPAARKAAKRVAPEPEAAPARKRASK